MTTTAPAPRMFSPSTLAEIRGETEAETRAWVNQNLFEVLALQTVDGTRYPAFQFDRYGNVHPELASYFALAQTIGSMPRQIWESISGPLDDLGQPIHSRGPAAPGSLETRFQGLYEKGLGRR